MCGEISDASHVLSIIIRISELITIFYNYLAANKFLRPRNWNLSQDSQDTQDSRNSQDSEDTDLIINNYVCNIGNKINSRVWGDF